MVANEAPELSGTALVDRPGVHLETSLDCGASVGVELRCALGHTVTIRDVVATPGPGARQR